MLSEKYRPRNLRDVVSNDDSINSLYKLSKKINFCNVLICGQTDIGKNSAVFSFLNQLRCNESETQLIEIGSLDEYNLKNTIDILKDFLESYLTNRKSKKLVVIKNGDFLSSQTQLCLREYLEKKIYRFSFWIICQSSFKINTAILSRCIQIHFKPQNTFQFTVRFKEILDKEKIQIFLETLEYLVDIGHSNFIRIFTLITEMLFLPTTKRISSLLIDRKYIAKWKYFYIKDFLLRDAHAIGFRKSFYLVKIYSTEHCLIFRKFRHWFYINIPNVICY
nr:DNA replication factor C complex subunit 3 [Cryptomonas sp.]UXY87370.1 DNA replication factor C complex subunit 3 [Cryptomonas sp.]